MKLTHDLPEQVGSLEEIAIQPGIRPESFPDKALKTGCTELTPGINRNDGATEDEWKTQGDVKTSTNAESGQASQGRGSEKHLPSGSDQLEPATDLWCSGEGGLTSPSDVKLNKDQHSVQQTSRGVNNQLSAADSAEMIVLSPASPTENPTEKTPSSNEPLFASTPLPISGSMTELPVSSESPSSEGGQDFREVTPEAPSAVSTSLPSEVVAPSLKVFGPNEGQEEKTASVDAAAPQKDSTPNLTVSTPALQSGEAPSGCGFDSDKSNVSTCEAKDKIEKIEAVSPTATAFPYQEQEGGADKDEADVETEENVQRHTGTDDQSSDLKSQFSTEEFLIQSQTETPQLAVKPVDQLPMNTATPETELKRGIKGQRVSL